MSNPSPSKLRHALPILIGVGLFAMGVYALYHLLRPVDAAEVVARARGMPTATLVGAVAATAVAYIALIGYDVLALRFVGHRLPARVIFLGGFLGYAFGNTIGISIVSGGAVRYRIYSAFGLNAFEVAAVSTYIAVALGVGLSLVGLVALSLHPGVIADLLPLPQSTVSVGAAAIVAVSLCVVFFVSWSGRSLRIWRFDLRLPPPTHLLGQLLVTLVDVAAASFTLWMLMPQGAAGFPSFVAIYAIATMVGVASHVPGGVGVFETVVIGTLPASVPVGDAAAGLLLFRMIYYLLPFVVGFALVSLNEARAFGGPLSRLFGRGSTQMRPAVEAINDVAPSLVAMAAFGLGVYLLLVSMVPTIRGSALTEGELMAALLLEGGTMLSAVSGVILLILSHGLLRRVTGAYWLMLAALAGGVVASLLNDIDLETASLLLAGIVLLLPFKGAFYRQAHLTEGLFSPAWFAVTLGVVLTTGGFFFFLHRATPYSTDLWIQISHGANTPRALRAALVASAILLIFSVMVAVRPVRRRPVAATALGAMDQVSRIVAQSGDPLGCLAFSGDKSFLFSERGNAMLMFGIEGSTWVALGDPIGPPEEIADLCWSFLDQAERANCRPMFYEIGADRSALYVEMGLALHRIGEEAIVPLKRIDLAEPAFEAMRDTKERGLREGLGFEILHPPHTPALLDRLEAISTAWLSDLPGREKQFSVGRFDRDYLDRFSIALVRRGGYPVAFANLLAPGDGRRVAIDLTRHLPQESPDLMPFLFFSLIEHFRTAGAEEVSLGIAPLEDLAQRSADRLWARFGRVVFRHGGSFRTFAELRRFKQSFQPVWHPRFVALPPGLSPTRAMTEITQLITDTPRRAGRKRRTRPDT